MANFGLAEVTIELLYQRVDQVLYRAEHRGRKRSVLVEECEPQFKYAPMKSDNQSLHSHLHSATYHLG